MVIVGCSLSRKRNIKYINSMNPALNYINDAPEPHRTIMVHLLLLIESTVPTAQLLYKWHLPFYYLNAKTMFCFLNVRANYVDLGMPYGIHLSNAHGVLIDGEKRKMLRSMRFYRVEDIDAAVVIKTLQELVEIRL